MFWFQEFSEVCHSDVNMARPVVSHHNMEINIREQYWPSWESLIKCTTKTLSSIGRRYGWHRRQRDDPWDIYVTDCQSCGAFWTRLSRESVYQEYRLRKGQAVVRHVTEMDLGSKRKLFLDIYNWFDSIPGNENYFATRKRRQAFENIGTRFLWFGTFFKLFMNIHDQ